ncbi:GTP 3',8-cyclase MoaA [Methanospirillum stamsii]|uniref:Probable GTP 3',8-cyclase n=1 Tax=Methanospirillum stamsii TaxID=1277351 RepID=A0A2V2NE44_9EURY|nr:GTP 3',8-cyclase MoaA [Methanospirillum stamsii]PWR74637.1 GTP 3',8-cyclase MoaA [Methanospirillum stamsii]
MDLHDNYGRPVSNIRIAVNSGCNLRCVYCHREGETKPDTPLPIEDIRAILDITQELGIRSVKFTGGEPLLREDIVDIIRAVPPGIESSLTTNGTLLAGYANELREAGLSRVNISLDSLNPETYRSITGVGVLSDVLEGIAAAREAGLTPIKINMVLLKGVNEGEVDDFIRLVSGDRQMILQIIELMDLGGCPLHADLSDLEDMIAAESRKVITRRMHHRKKYCYDGAEIEFVRPFHNSEFCRYCNRLRVTSDGKLKPCLLRDDNLVDIRGKRGEELLELFRIAAKKRQPYNQ